MAYFVEIPSSSPYFLMGDLSEFESKIPNLSKRAEYSKVFKDGSRILTRNEVPISIEIKNKLERIPDAFRSTNGLLVVSHEIQSIIESIEPNIHQFFEIQVGSKRTVVSRLKFYVINIHQKIDSIVDSESCVTSILPDDKSMMVMRVEVRKKKIVLDRRKNAGHHLWREFRFPGSLLISDKLQEEFQQHKLKFFRIWKCVEL